jgi:hypothetical protein
VPISPRATSEHRSHGIVLESSHGRPVRPRHEQACPTASVAALTAFSSVRRCPIAEFFAYAVDKRLAPFWLPFWLRPSKDGVTITDEETFRATFGFLSVETPLTNIDEAHITRNYRWWTAAGARGSMVDDGLTFGTNSKAGVCVHFRQPVPSPLRRKGHSALTVTVADVDRLVDRLAR